MKTVFNNQGKGWPHMRLLLSLSILFLIVVVTASVFAAFALNHSSKEPQPQSHINPTRAIPTPSPTATATPKVDPGFSFTEAGDYGQTNYTTANLNYIAQQYTAHKINFHLALGDFSYNTSISAAAWSAYAKSHLPTNFPFEILSGGHDDTQIDAYAANLPNHIGKITGTYAKQYYFDYPQEAPLARFILVSPSGVIGGFNYNKGGTDYNWVANAIDTARDANIHWVIVAMHQYCFVIDSTSCAGQDLLDLLLSRHVDLILQAQKHNYQASKQLALNSACPVLPITSYNAHCVVNASTHMSKGAGSVIVVSGTGGTTTPQLTINTSDPKISYFRKWMGANVNETWGVSQFTITPTRLTMRFVNVSGNFTDGFTLSG